MLWPKQHLSEEWKKKNKIKEEQNKKKNKNKNKIKKVKKGVGGKGTTEQWMFCWQSNGTATTMTVQTFSNAER